MKIDSSFCFLSSWRKGLSSGTKGHKDHLCHLHEEHKHDQSNLTFEDSDLEKTEEIKDAYKPRI